MFSYSLPKPVHDNGVLYYHVLQLPINSSREVTCSINDTEKVVLPNAFADFVITKGSWKYGYELQIIGETTKKPFIKKRVDKKQTKARAELCFELTHELADRLRIVAAQIDNALLEEEKYFTKSSGPAVEINSLADILQCET